jgi:two-component system, cell cycle response regulator DivK
MKSAPYVLVVEDNAMNADVLKENLIDAGYAFTLAVNGAAGVAIANDMLPDIILMDVNLPIMDGLSATRLLKQNSTTQGIPIVALTARAMAGDQEMCLAAGCDDYISKPVDIDTLLAKMRHHIERRPSTFVEMIRRLRTAADAAKPPVNEISTKTAREHEEQVEALTSTIERLQRELAAARLRVSELDTAVTERDAQITAMQKERDGSVRDASGRIAKLIEERDRLRADRDALKAQRDAARTEPPVPVPVPAPAPDSGEAARKVAEDLDRANRRTRKLTQQLELAMTRNKELSQQLEAVPGDLRTLQVQHDGLRKAFLQLHRSVVKAAEDALHKVAFGSEPAS